MTSPEVVTDEAVKTTVPSFVDRQSEDVSSDRCRKCCKHATLLLFKFMFCRLLNNHITGAEADALSVVMSAN